MNRIVLATFAILCAASLWAKQPIQAYDPYGEETVSTPEMVVAPQETNAVFSKEKKSSVLSGFSFGLMGNLGYGFSSTPEQAFQNGSLTELTDYNRINKSNITLGAGVMGRLHLVNHIHLGAEGYVSMLPLMKTGSSVRHAYAGALIDGYLSLGSIVLELGTGIGGGKVKRMFVPEHSEMTGVTAEDGMVYNASYTTTPYFYIDPYIGLEVHFAGITGLLIKIDYVLPFGKTDNGYLGDMKDWSSFIKPSGPRLHIGLLLGKK